MQNIIRLFLPVIIIIFGTGYSSAQMFSVDERPQRFSFSNTYLRIGTSITDFTYIGNLVGVGSSSALNVSDPVLSIMFESMGLSGSAIVGNNIFGLDDQAFFDLNLKFSNGFPFIRTQSIQAGIPLQLNTGITTSNSDDLSDRFSQTNLAAGIGGFVNSNFSRRIRLQTEGIVGYGFSNSSGGFFGGTLFYIHGKARLNILNLIGERALSVGYDYNFKSFDVDEEQYDFELSAHQITLGISL